MCSHIQQEEMLFVHSKGGVLNYVETLGYGWRADLILNAIKEVESIESTREY